MPPEKYLWNPSDFGCQITRRRNFFPNFDDVESIHSSILVFGAPLLKPNGDMIPLALLLRTRDTLPNGIIRASWTLYPKKNTKQDSKTQNNHSRTTKKAQRDT